MRFLTFQRFQIICGVENTDISNVPKLEKVLDRLIWLTHILWGNLYYIQIDHIYYLVVDSKRFVKMLEFRGKEDIIHLLN